LDRQRNQQEMLELERLKQLMLQRLVRRSQKACIMTEYQRMTKSHGLYSLDID